jgi:hypothetical protein
MVITRVGLFSGRDLDHFSTDGHARDVDVMNSRLQTTFLFWLILSNLALADGGTIRLQTDTGSFHITVFTQPPILAAGPADITVLVQNRKDLVPVMDATLALDLIPLEGTGEKSWMPPSSAMSTSPSISAIPARLNHGENRLLYGATVQIPHSGRWGLRIHLRRASETSTAETLLTVAPPTSPPLAYWHLFALPGVCAGIFILHQIALRARKKRKLSFAPLPL